MREESAGVVYNVARKYCFLLDLLSRSLNVAHPCSVSFCCSSLSDIFLPLSTRHTRERTAVNMC
jgi:hypothetical protein